MCIIRLFRVVIYQKLFLEEAYTLDRFAFEVFLSVYIFQSSIARMLKFRLLTDSDSMLSHTWEADEVFKKNLWQQGKRMSRNWFANSPKTGTI